MDTDFGVYVPKSSRGKVMEAETTYAENFLIF